MKQIIASVLFYILSYTIGNNILCFKNFELYLIQIGRFSHIAVKETVSEIMK